MAHRNWARVGATWFPISNLPRGLEAVLFADSSQAIQWMVEGPLKADQKATNMVDKGRRDEHDNPVLEGEQVEAAYWAPVELT